MTARASLDEIAREHGTDKSTRGHGFTTIYERFLSDLRDQPMSVLEIGVYRGASVRMWRDYFPRGRIVGIDKKPTAMDYSDDRIAIRIGSQTDFEFLDEVATAEGPFDVVIDDGSHRADGQKLSLERLWPHLKPGGLYVIEDIHTSYLEKYGMGWREPGSTVERLKWVIDDLHRRFHDRAASLPNVESIHFYFKLCVIRRVGGR